MSTAAVREAQRPEEEPGKAWNLPIGELRQESYQPRDFQGPESEISCIDLV